MCIYIYIYIERESEILSNNASGRPSRADECNSPARVLFLRTKILDVRGFDSSRILYLQGWNSHAHGESPGFFESRNLSRDNLRREVGRFRLRFGSWIGRLPRVINRCTVANRNPSSSDPCSDTKSVTSPSPEGGIRKGGSGKQHTFNCKLYIYIYIYIYTHDF